MSRLLRRTSTERQTLLSWATAAATVATLAVWNHYQARRAVRQHPPIGRFVEVEGVRLHYLEKGTGTAVVLLHGNTVTVQDMVCSGLFDQLAEKHRVIAFDRPGYGFSERPRNRLWTSQAQARLFREALKQLDVKQPVVLGHSWGTLVALDLAVD
ncbi:alpha/beta hydrolase fold protein [Caballeronia arvi]|uniref:Alpha/beta hydrolase fold protein n=1 Tax=Caballeronia arvi TaxID=1777135 RepID=A0A158L068_9BURK|nr:alpha/beta fold hydrolase [Caballeronia arvi]SAL86767.1 alpha/beta hydrolase fold protein [Caballeronia arvi]